MRRLLPSPEPLRSVEAVESAYGYPAALPWVRANVVASVDGAATSDGVSAGLSGPADRRLLGTLRSLADVVVVGAGTARAEAYRPVRPRPSAAARRATDGQAPAAALAVVSASLDLDPDEPLFTDPHAKPLLLTCARAPARRRAALEHRGAEVVVVGDARVDLGAALDHLVGRGLRRILCEGGPSLLAQLAAVGRLDELCLTISPLLAGGHGPRILAGPALPSPAALRLAGLFEDDGFLFCRYLLLR